jgi:hypothetical protein
MWKGFFVDVSFNNPFANVKEGLDGVLKALTSLNSSSPPTPVETSKKLGNVGLIKNGLSILHPELEESISIESHHRETILISNFIQDPKTYLSSTENKLATTKAIIKNIEGLEKDGRKIPQNIKKIITDHKKNSSIITAEELKPLSDFYIQLADKTIVDKTNASFSFTDTKSKSQNKPLQTPIHSAPFTAPPSRNIAPSSYQPPSHPARTPWDHRHGNQTVGQDKHSRRADNRASSRVSSMTRSDDGVVRHVATTPMSRTPSHPAGIKPQTNLSKKQEQPQKPLTGPGARNAVLRNGIRPTNFQSGDATRANEEHLEKIGKDLARLEFELSQIKINRGDIDKVKNRPGLGSNIKRKTKGYGNEASNKQKEIDTLTEALFVNHTQDDINKVYASKTKELARLKDAPRTAPRNVRGAGPLAGSDRGR